MTVLSLPAVGADGPTSGRDDPATCDDGVRMRALCRHQATVVTITGNVDAANVDRVHAFATRVVPVANAVILDLSGVNFSAAQGFSVLIAVGEACFAAGVPWALVPSPVVCRVLRLIDGGTTVPTASSVPAALRQLTALAHRRRQFALAVTAAPRHAV